MECQLDFARLGLIGDPAAGRRRVAHALIFTVVYSRHMFVWLTSSQTLAAVIEGAEERGPGSAAFPGAGAGQHQPKSPSPTPGEPDVHRWEGWTTPDPPPALIKV